jgi:hypothetical protein
LGMLIRFDQCLRSGKDGHCLIIPFDGPRRDMWACRLGTETAS